VNPNCCIEHRRRTVEVRGKPTARVALQQRIEPDVNRTHEVRGDNAIGQGQIGPVRALPPAADDGEVEQFLADLYAMRRSDAREKCAVSSSTPTSPR
jgi:hypothetical protein